MAPNQCLHFIRVHNWAERRQEGSRGLNKMGITEPGEATVGSLKAAVRGPTQLSARGWRTETVRSEFGVFVWVCCLSARVMQDRRWPRHKGQVGLQRVWRRLLLCCSCEHQEESLDKEALIVVPVSGILILNALLILSLLIYCFVLGCLLTQFNRSFREWWQRWIGGSL